MSVSFCLPHPVAVSAFMICRGLCACTEMLWMCVLYVSFGSKVRPRTFGCVAMGSALLFIVRSRLLIYSAGSGVNRVQVVLSGFSKRLFCFVQAKTLCMYGCMYFLAALVSTSSSRTSSPAPPPRPKRRTIKKRDQKSTVDRYSRRDSSVSSEKWKASSGSDITSPSSHHVAKTTRTDRGEAIS